MFNIIKMLPLVSFLAALRIFTEAQTCNNGLGKLVYEKVADYRLIGTGMNFNGNPKPEVMRRKELPIKVLTECIRRCREDKMTTIETCLSFDFAPGRRHSSPFQNTDTNMHGSGLTAEYDDSQCIFYGDRASPDGGENLVKQENAWHFNEICLNSNKLTTDCPNRLYVFERQPGYKFESNNDKEFHAQNRTDCEEQCLNEPNYECRSATYDRSTSKCKISTENRYMNPKGFKIDTNTDYMENLCLKQTEMCKMGTFFVDSNKELDGPFERELLATHDSRQCSELCTNSLDERGFLCRSFLYDELGHTCILYDEDAFFIGETTDQVTRTIQVVKRPMKNAIGNLFRVACISKDKDRAHNEAYYDSPPLISPPMHTYSRYDAFPAGPFYPPNPLNSPHPPATIGSSLSASWASLRPDFHRAGFATDTRFSPFQSQPPPPPPPMQSSIDYRNKPPTSPFFQSNQSPQITGSNFLSNPSLAPPSPPNHQPLNPLSPLNQAPPPPTGMNYPIPYHGSIIDPNSLAGMYPFPGSNDRCKFPPMSQQLQAPPTAALGNRFNKVGFTYRMKSMYITRVIKASTLEECERSCLESRDFVCSSFNFRRLFSAENCELSQHDTKKFPLTADYFEHGTQYDYYERELIPTSPIPVGVAGGAGTGSGGSDCIEVTQSCTPDGMEFTLKTMDPFHGRIYTYSYYDSCFFDGKGGNVNVLRISRANGFPRCGTQQHGDAMSNLVVVQFNDYVQTSRDKKYNITCYFSGPGEAVVTSSYLDTKTDGRYPTQIEQLPIQNILTSNVVLRVLYRGKPTDTIFVGDLLTFRLEARSHYRYDLYNSDIFATNVIAKDPMTGRQVNLIDSRGCPMDLFVFPELHKTPDGALEAEFYAFKIPDSNFLVFEATVRTCRGPCEPVICSDSGLGRGPFPSWGRRKRSIGSHSTPIINKRTNSSTENDKEEVRELLRVYMSRDDVPSSESEPLISVEESKVCISPSGYYVMVTAIVILLVIISSGFISAFFFLWKNKLQVNRNVELKKKPVQSQYFVALDEKSEKNKKLQGPSEPIYSDPSLFERPRSLQSVTMTSASKLGRNIFSG